MYKPSPNYTPVRGQEASLAQKGQEKSVKIMIQDLVESNLKYNLDYLAMRGPSINRAQIHLNNIYNLTT